MVSQTISNKRLVELEQIENDGELEGDEYDDIYEMSHINDHSLDQLYQMGYLVIEP